MHFLYHVYVNFLWHLASQNGAFWELFVLKNVYSSKRIKNQDFWLKLFPFWRSRTLADTGRRSRCSRFALFAKYTLLNQHVSQKAPFWETKCHQKWSKTRCKNSTDFWLAFWAFLSSFWEPFWHQKAPKSEPKQGLIFDVFFLDSAFKITPIQLKNRLQKKCLHTNKIWPDLKVAGTRFWTFKTALHLQVASKSGSKTNS